eukprot:scaffold550_cov238-Pinguiococcus_pyrenoidosus.AAC.5
MEALRPGQGVQHSALHPLPEIQSPFAEKAGPPRSLVLLPRQRQPHRRGEEGQRGQGGPVGRRAAHDSPQGEKDADAYVAFWGQLMGPNGWNRARASDQLTAEEGEARS